MVYCLKCGNKMHDDDLLCPKCGARRNCNCEAFVIAESEEESKSNGMNRILERMKRLFSKR